ncbi:MAG TPA: radical SAM protein [Candidatus Bathyarchaeia archaeon]|nr:radical SAM protein [Candidatus Bathyarchaeia archaeon]
MTLLRPFDPWRSPLCTCLNKLTFNPYTGCDHKCIYCYATSYVPHFYNCRPKTDLLKRLKTEAQRLNGQLISIANSSDPYPTIEKTLQLTRQCLKTLSNQNCRIQIITKSNLVTRDTDILQKTQSAVAFTITTDNDALAKQLEPNAPPPSQRMRAIETLTQRGIPVCVRIDPIIPSLNDNSADLIKTLATLGVKHVTSSTYKIKQDNWKRFRQVFPPTAQQLAPLYFKRGEKMGGYRYLPAKLRYNILKGIREQTTQAGMTFGTCREGFPQLNTATCDGAEYCQHQR